MPWNYFTKIYSCYYNVVRHILDEVGHSPINPGRIWRIYAALYGFQESALSIIPKTDGQHMGPSWKNRTNIPFTSRLAMLFLRPPQ